MSNPEIIMSPLCRKITVDGITIQIDIYRGEDDSGWILEVIDEENASTIPVATPWRSREYDLPLEVEVRRYGSFRGKTVAGRPTPG